MCVIEIVNICFFYSVGLPLRYHKQRKCKKSTKPLPEMIRKEALECGEKDVKNYSLFGRAKALKASFIILITSKSVYDKLLKRS